MDNKLPIISVVTVCYNCKDAIEETLFSVISQTYPNIEYIIIDGASSDGTVDIIESKIQNLDKKIIFTTEPDDGIYDAMNKGLEMVSGDWVIFMNGGDKFVNSSVLSEIFLAKEDYKEFDVLYGDTIQKYNGIGSFRRSYAGVNPEMVFGSVCHQATLVRAHQLKRIGFPVSYKICADFAALKMIYNSGGKFHYLPLVIAEFDQTDGASAYNFIEMFSESVRLYDIRKYSNRWFKGYAKAYVKQSFLTLITKENFAKLRYQYLKRKFKK